MEHINYDNKKFKAVSNSATSEVDGATVFHYYQEGKIIWANYAGGAILKGQLLGKCNEEGVIEFSYHHINVNQEIKTGTCVSTPEILNDGRIRLNEFWQWTCGDYSKGESIIEESRKVTAH